MTRNVRTYDHFCLVARALESVGDRWTLLVIRDLLDGTRRFTDLMDRLGGITPKTLSQRLRELLDAGIVAVDREPGRREVWYRLTPIGEDLQPVIDALGWWGLKHAWRLPLEGEPLHPEHLLRAATQAIDVTAEAHDKAIWHFRVDEVDYVIKGDGRNWSHGAGTPDGEADVTVTATINSLKGFILGISDAGVVISGQARDVQRFRQLIVTLASLVPEPRQWPGPVDA
jgi:DNA-binding HxlR family transcriptional regulator